MRKQVKLPPSKSQKDAKASKNEDKGGFVFFVKDQGEGAGKVVVIILKVLELILTTIFAVVLGIFGPLCIWYGDIVDAEVASDPSAVWWLVSSIVYIVGLFVLMFGHSRIATGIHLAAAVGTLITYNGFSILYENNNPAPLFMPSLFITVLSVAIMLVINIPKWIKKRIERDSEEAPSILDGKKKK